MSSQKLTYFVYKKDPDSWYRIFRIKKRNGSEREIAAPSGPMLTMQRKLAQGLSAAYHPHHSVHGFVAGRGITTNARGHAGRPLVFNIDLEDFFPSIHFGRVRGLLMGRPLHFPGEVATTMARILTRANSIPQGAPSSPLVSNLICRGLDHALSRLAFENGCTYSRYADDITFSTKRDMFPAEIVQTRSRRDLGDCQPGEQLTKIITEAGFRINGSKTRIQSARVRQQVTGLTVNLFPNVRRSLVRQVRSMLHAWEKYGVERAELEYRERYCLREPKVGTDGLLFRAVVRGKIDFIRQVRGTACSVYRRLWRRFVALNPGAERPAVAERDGAGMVKRDLFLCHASEDKDAIVRPVAKELAVQGVTFWLDEAELALGDQLATKIDEGLETSRFAVVFWSPSFSRRRWPKAELNALLCREQDSGEVVVIPLLIGNEEEAKALRKQSPLLAGKVFARWTGSAAETAATLAKHLRGARGA